MSDFDPQAYGPVFAPLLNFDRRRPLDAGRADSEARSALKELSVESAFAHTRIADRDMAACCISGAWLLHDCLEESHKISQDIETPSGSFWHGIMHRREGDFGNSKYWFRRVGSHPAFEMIADCAKRAADLRTQEWDPFVFVDRCQSALRANPNEQDACLDLQQIEWESLFDYCYREATRK